MSVLRLIPQKGEAIVVDADEALVGREANCNVFVPHPSVSRRHALIKRRQDVFFLIDQGSANGTFVDSKRIVDATLKEGNVLRFGSASFKVEVRDELPVESVGEDELVVAPTMVGQPAFSATLHESPALPDEIAPSWSGPDTRHKHDDAPAPTVQSPLPAPPRVPPRAAEARPSQPVRKEAVVPPGAPPGSVAPNRGPAFWLMIAAGALALIFVGAALGFGVAFFARRAGFL